jgi:hypothetical protein
MSEAGVPPERAQEILGHAYVRRRSRYTRAMWRRQDDSADRMAELAGLARIGRHTGDKQRYNAGATANKYLYKWLPGLDSNQRPTD